MIAQWMGFEHLRGTARKHCRKCKCRSHSLLSKDNALVNTVVFNCRRFNQYPRSQAKSLWSHSVLVFSECHCLLFSEILYIFLESDNFPEIWYFLKIWCFLSFCKYSKIGEFFPKNLRVLQNLEFYKIWNSPKKILKIFRSGCMSLALWQQVSGAGSNEYSRVLNYSPFKSLLVPYSENFSSRASSRVVRIFAFCQNFF